MFCLLRSSYQSVISHKQNWKHCIVNLNDTIPKYLYISLRKYGYLITTLTLRGFCTHRVYERLFYLIQKYCTNLEFIDSFGLPYFFPLGTETRAFSMTFPSSVSDYVTLMKANEHNMIYSTNDSIIQCLDTRNQDFDGFMQSIWQFEIDNHIQRGFCITLRCYINEFVVGSFTLNDCTVASTYAINLMFPVPKCTMEHKRKYLILSVRCCSQLPFGAGYVRFSSVGRVSFIKGCCDLKFVERHIPSFQP